MKIYIFEMIIYILKTIIYILKMIIYIFKMKIYILKMKIYIFEMIIYILKTKIYIFEMIIYIIKSIVNQIQIINYTILIISVVSNLHRAGTDLINPFRFITRICNPSKLIVPTVQFYIQHSTFNILFIKSVFIIINQCHQRSIFS